MKNKHLCKHISLFLAILMLLPLFAFGTTAEEAEISAAQSAEKAEADALAAKKADLVQGLEGQSTIFNYIDKASFIKAGHVERLPEEEDLNSYVFRNEDGSKTVYFLDEDVKFVNAGGVVTEKKLELVALDGGFTTRSSNVSLALPTDLSRGITLAHGGATVSLVPNKASLSEVASVATASLFAAVEELEQSLVSAPMGISLGRADYQNAFGVGTTLRYTPTLSGVKEDVILDRYRGKNSFSFTLNTGNLTVFEENGRYFLAESAEDEEKIFIGETWVYDSADHFEKGTLSVNKKADGVYTLTIGASVSFLTDPDTVYPVYIDPTLTVSYGNNGEGYIEDVTVYSGNADTNYGGANLCFVGKHPSYGTARTAIRFPGLADAYVLNARNNVFIASAILTLRAQTGVSTAATAYLYPLENHTWTESGATWRNIGYYQQESLAEGALLVNANMSFDLTNFITDWSIDDARYPNFWEQGFLMVSSNETVQKRFCSSEITTSSYKPVLQITYSEGVEIMSPDQRYRVVEDDEIVYIKQGEIVQLEAAVQTSESMAFQWTSSNNSIVTIPLTSVTSCLLNPISCGTVTISIKNGTNIVLDSITVCVVPVVPGEYYFVNKEYLRGLCLENINLVSGDIVGLEENYCIVGQEISSLLKYKCYSGTWIFEYNSSGYYTIKYKSSSENSAFYLSYDGEAQSLIISSSINTYSRWIIQRTTSGSFKLIPYVERTTGNCILVTATPTIMVNEQGVSCPITEFHLSLDAYTNNALTNDEWEISSAEVTLLNYYDSSIEGDTTIIRDIEIASQVVANLFEQWYDVHINITTPTQLPDYIADQCPEGIDEPCDDECGTCSNQDNGYSANTGTACYHHKNTKRIAMQLADQCQSNEMPVMWSNRSPNTFCTMNVNTEEFRSEYGITYSNIPAIQILLNKDDFVYVDGSNNSHARIAQMVACLIHEIGHYYGLGELYDIDGSVHDEKKSSITCVMRKLKYMYLDIATLSLEKNIEVFYEKLLSGSIEPFCDECKQELCTNGSFYCTMYQKRR